MTDSTPEPGIPAKARSASFRRRHGWLPGLACPGTEPAHGRVLRRPSAALQLSDRPEHRCHLKTLLVGLSFLATFSTGSWRWA